MTSDFAGISETVDNYARAFHAGDIDRLRALFFPSCVLRSIRDEAIAEYSVGDWLAHLGTRQSAAASGSKLDYAIRSIDFAGPDCAAVIVEMSVPGTRFTDGLHLLREQSSWRIVAKTFHAYAS
jgi:hypothetical protein